MHGSWHKISKELNSLGIDLCHHGA
jgi:hypothetical protein